MDPSALPLLFDAFKQAQNVNFAHVSSLTVIVYDICLTQGLEIKHIWGSRWSAAKILYLIGRYYTVFHLSLTLAVSSTPGIGVTTCNAFFRINGFGLQILANITDALLIMRLRCMYRNSSMVTRVLGVFFVIQFIIEAIVIGFSTSSTNAVNPPPWLSSWPGCFYTNAPPRYVLAAWVPSLLFATTLFGMTLHKLWEFHREGVKPGGLFTIFARDGAMFFAMIFGLEMLNTMVTAVVTDGRLLEIGVPWIIACYGVVSSRLILNLREYSAEIQQLTLPGHSKMTAAANIHFRHSESTAVDDAQM